MSAPGKAPAALTERNSAFMTLSRPNSLAGRPAWYLSTAWAVLSRPRAFFAEMPRDNILDPLVFLLITQVGAALLAWPGSGSGPLQVLRGLAQALGQQLVVAALVWASARLVMKSTLTPAQGLGIVAYAGVLWFVAFLAPLLPHPAGTILLVLVGLVHLYLMLVGLQAAAELWVPLAAACLIMAVVGLFLLVTLLGVFGLA